MNSIAKEGEREREKERLTDGMFSLCVCVRESALNPIEV